MNRTGILTAVVACHFAIPAWLPAQQVKPQTNQEYECYVQAAETRMADRKTLTANGSKIETTPGNGANPHKISGAMIYDWIGTVFIPGTTVDRTVRMLQDYDHRARYFPEMISTSKLLCRSGEDRFGFSMRLKEPAVIDTENDVVWERIDARHWRCRSYSTKVQEVGKPHNYLLRLNSYWRFTETGQGVSVEAQTITLSGEFGSFMRSLGSMMGINPEKSLRKTLESMRESVLRPGQDFARPPAGPPDCGAPVRMNGCPASSDGK
jgi:hypothetical protein